MSVSRGGNGVSLSAAIAIRPAKSHPGKIWILMGGALAAVVVAFFAVPMGIEQTPGECTALESRFLETTLASLDEPMKRSMINRELSQSDGSLAAALLQRLHPSGPPSMVSCATVYWQSTFDPGEFAGAMPAAGAGGS